MFPASVSIPQKRGRCLRLALGLTAVVFYCGHSWGGEIVFTSTTTEVHTLAPNNDDYAGEFDDNPNRVRYGSPPLDSLEGIFAVRDSGGTTEYTLTMGGSYNSAAGPPLSNGYKIEVGFGTGDHFVPVSQVLSGLDFDAPLPSDPALPTSISYLGIFPIFDLVSHESDTIQWSGHDLNGEFFMSGMFQIPLDVPDLSVSVLDFYDAGDLPPDFPAGAAAFTVRGSFISELVAGDYNGSGQVEQADLDLVLLNWGHTCPPPPPGWTMDFWQVCFADGVVDQNDLDGVLMHWGNPATAADVVPEPTTWLLLLGVILCLSSRQRWSV